LATIPPHQVLRKEVFKINNPFIIIKNWIKRKQAEFIYDEIDHIIMKKIRESLKNVK